MPVKIIENNNVEKGEATDTADDSNRSHTNCDESTSLLMVHEKGHWKNFSSNVSSKVTKFKSKSCNIPPESLRKGNASSYKKQNSYGSHDDVRSPRHVANFAKVPPTAIKPLLLTNTEKATNNLCYYSLPEALEKIVYEDISDGLKKGAHGDSDLEQKGCARFLGIFLTLGAALQFSLSALIIKVLGYHPFNLGVWRFGVMTLVPIPFLIHAVAWQKQRFFEDIWPTRSVRTTVLILLQAVVAGNSIISFFFGVKYLNIADCITIGTSAPVFVTLVAFMVLGERCGLFPVVTALLTLVGVGIISKPPMLTGAETLNEESMFGVASSFSSMMLLTICYVMLRYLRKVHHAVLNLCFGLWGFFQCTVMATAMGVIEVPKSYNEAGLIILSALLAFSAQTCITLALKYEQAGPVALVRTSEVVFAFGWQAIFLGVKPDVYSVVGAVVTLSGVVLTAFRKMVISLPEESKYKRWFAFLLY